MNKLAVALILIFFSVTPVLAASSLDQINQTICTRFEEDTSRLAGIMEEVKKRQGIKETRVAYGNINSQIETADYYVTYAAEAIAFERAQKFSSAGGLKSSLEVLRQKVLRARTEVGKTL